MVTTMAIIGDLIPPAERGRYQGTFGAVFALATVIGPADRRFLCRASVLALDILHQSAARAGCVPGDRNRSAHALQTETANDRLSGRHSARDCLSAIVIVTSLSGTLMSGTPGRALGGNSGRYRGADRRLPCGRGARTCAGSCRWNYSASGYSPSPRSSACWSESRSSVRPPCCLCICRS